MNSKILKLVDNTNGNEFTISYENLSKDFLESIILHKVDVLPNGFRFVDEFVKLFNVNDFGFLMYTTIRDPFERAVSLYNYINSSISSHEPNHKSLGLLTFDQYISSSEAEDSWLIRNLLDLPDSERAIGLTFRTGWRPTNVQEKFLDIIRKTAKMKSEKYI